VYRLLHVVRILLIASILLLGTSLVSVADISPVMVDISTDEQDALEAAAKDAWTSHDLRAWKRYQAILMLASEPDVVSVAIALDCAESSIMRWVTRWREQGIKGLMSKKRPEHYMLSVTSYRRIDRILELREKGLSWGGIALVMGYKTAAGPWRLWHRSMMQEDAG
jgi:hypothetical protein